MPEKIISSGIAFDAMQVDDYSKKLFAVSEMVRLFAVYSKVPTYSTSGALQLPGDMLNTIGIGFSEKKTTGEKCFNLFLPESLYGVFSEIGIKSAYWEDDGIVIVLKSFVLVGVSIPFTRFYIPFSSLSLLERSKQLNKLLICSFICTTPHYKSELQFAPSRVYPELLTVLKSAKKLGATSRGMVDKLLR